MKERPILFSAPMIKAILDGQKTQTRRVVKGAESIRHFGRCEDDRGYVHPDRKCSPLTGEHSINNLLRQVTSELVRQSLVGHADEAIGRRYSVVDLNEKRAAVAAIEAARKAE